MLDRIDTALKRAGTDKSKLLTAQVWLADMGDYHGDEVQACLEAGITPYVARPITSANKKLGLFSKDDLQL